MDSFSPITAARMCSCTSPRSKKQGSAHSNEGAKVSYEEVPNKGKTSAENLRVG